MSNKPVSSDLPFKVRIVWGSASYRHDVGNEPEEYAFATRDELDPK